MNRFPKVVQEAQILSRSDADLKKLLKIHLKEFTLMEPGEKKAKYMYQLIEEQLIKTDLSNTSCQKGCHYCCYHPIELTSSEKENIVLQVESANKKRLAYQVDQIFNDDIYENWDYKKQACVFLDEQGGCKIYQDRPLICRLTYVTSNSENCDYRQDTESIAHHPVTKAAIIALAYLMTEQDSHLLPLALLDS